ncbi:MAG TPA: AraC family transcriptional regulator [Kofleriaceae bacterium]|nr:AraC family transcriptional regulator [Kofleriaceae bacterium]
MARRESLAFDTKFAASVSGKPEAVGHLFLMSAGRWLHATGETLQAPVAFLLGDDEIERLHKTSRTFRTDGAHVDVVQLRIAKPNLRAPVGIANGPIALPPPAWDAIRQLVAHAPRGDWQDVARLLDALASANVVTASMPKTVIAEEPERFRRLWEALEPLYSTYGATTSLKQLASSLGMSMRQVGRDAKELSAAFGIGGGYRDALLMVRLRAAVLLLSAPEATVADVAKVVGYGSPIALARAFRDAKLPSPSVVQAAIRGEPVK